MCWYFGTELFVFLNIYHLLQFCRSSTHACCIITLGVVCLSSVDYVCFLLHVVVQVEFLATVIESNSGNVAIRSIRLTVDLEKCKGSLMLSNSSVYRVCLILFDYDV